MYVSHPLIQENAIEERLYQKAFVKSAKEKNTLIVAPTALGKTVVAVLLSIYFLEKMPEKKILILAPTRPLAAQHATRFREFLTINESKINVLTGTTSPANRKEIWKNSTVISATPHVIKNDFIKNRYTPDDISLAVFDEAHRAVGKYPYTYLAPKLNCRILALTASPGGDDETIQVVCANLNIEDVEIRDESDPDVVPYVKGFDIEWKKVKLPEPMWVMRNILLGLLRKRLKILKRGGIIKSASTDVSKKTLLTTLSDLQERVKVERSPSLFSALSASSGTITIAHALDLLETQGLRPLSSYLNRVNAKASSAESSKAVRTLALDPQFKRVFAMTENLKERFNDPKIDALKAIISETRKGTKIIVFTQYRDTAKGIVEIIKDIDGVSAVRFVGQGTRGNDLGLSQKKQLEILGGFKKGEYNVLVATSVAEEGLDIPAVDLVVFYEPVSSEIRVIQRRGRTGRTRVGKVVVLIAEKTRDEGSYWSGVAREKRMKKSLRRLKSAGDVPKEKKITDWG